MEFGFLGCWEKTCLWESGLGEGSFTGSGDSSWVSSSRWWGSGPDLQAVFYFLFVLFGLIFWLSMSSTYLDTPGLYLQQVPPP